jgi:hypothetical protein
MKNTLLQKAREANYYTYFIRLFKRTILLGYVFSHVCFSILLGQNRSHQAVIAKGENVSCYLGVDPADMVGFRMENNNWEQIPIQIDERAILDAAVPYNSPQPIGAELLLYTDPNTFTGADPNPEFDENDELVFMFSDAGSKDPGLVNPPGTIPGSKCEVAICDPVTMDTSFIYLFENAGFLLQSAGEDYVDYEFVLLSGDYRTTYNLGVGFNPENSIIETDYYINHFSDRWIQDELYLNDGVTYTNDLLDRHKNFFFPGICGRTEETFSFGDGCMIANIDGPIRAVRSYFGANSGPFTQRTHFYYQKEHTIRTDLRVHHIPAIFDVFDYSVECKGSSYFNSLGEQFSIDGIPEIADDRRMDWEVINLTSGHSIQTSHLIFGTFQDSIDGIIRKVWEDNETNPLDTCTGDDFSYGSSGHLVEFFDDICTDTIYGSCDASLFRTLISERKMVFGVNMLTEPEAQEIDLAFRKPPLVSKDSCVTTYASIQVESCEDYTSPSGKYTWSQTGMYMDTINNASGCDSVLTIDLTILSDSFGSSSISSCGSYTSPSRRYVWTQSGMYMDTITANNGCDSILTIDLTVLPNAMSTIIESACNSYRSPSGRYIWTRSDTYQDTLPASNGCDSIITIDLTINRSQQSSISPIACNQYISPSGNYTWTQSGTYLDTLLASNGCDSIVVINLTIEQDRHSGISVEACKEFMSPSGRYVWSQTGIYMDTIVASNGCDSIITIDLTIVQEVRSSIQVEECEDYTSPSGRYTWTQSGTYLDTIPSYQGCDSIISIILTIENTRRSSIQVEVCKEYTSPSGQFTWNQSGQYTDTIPRVSGCDSIIDIDLTILPEGMSAINVEACEEYRSPSGFYIWERSGIYFDTVLAANGCDSIIRINLTINYNQSSRITVESCNEYRSPSGNFVWNRSGIYTDILPASNGCDSIITIDLTIKDDKRRMLIVEACEEYISPSGTQIWTQSGLYTETLPASNGCDSIITVDLTIYRNQRSMIQVNACEQYESPSGRYVWSNSGFYLDTLTSSNGCDSVISIDLAIFRDSRAVVSIERCKEYVSPSGLYTWSMTGVYRDTIVARNGCDSILTIELEIVPPKRESIEAESCDTYRSPSGRYLWTRSGIYMDTIPTSDGCDSILTIELNIVPEKRSMIDAEACVEYNSPSGRYVWDQSGTYLDTLQSYEGCDSILTISLEIVPEKRSFTTAEACKEYISPSGNYTWTQNGTYVDTLMASEGCDSIITIELKILQALYDSINIETCNPYISPSGRYVWDQSGVFQDTIPSVEGCDSIITIDLSLFNIQNELIIFEDSLQTTEIPGARYIWLDCEKGDTLQIGNSASFAPQISGNYQVILEYLECSDTSECLEFIINYTEEPFNPDIQIIPNPVKHNLSIMGLPIGSKYFVLDILGQVVFKDYREQIDVSGLSEGTYLLVIPDLGITRKFLKAR